MPTPDADTADRKPSSRGPRRHKTMTLHRMAGRARSSSRTRRTRRWSSLRRPSTRSVHRGRCSDDSRRVHLPPQSGKTSARSGRYGMNSYVHLLGSDRRLGAGRPDRHHRPALIARLSAAASRTVTVPRPRATQPFAFQSCSCWLTTWRETPRKFARSSCEILTVRPPAESSPCNSPSDKQPLREPRGRVEECRILHQAAGPAQPLAAEPQELERSLRLPLEQLDKMARAGSRPARTARSPLRSRCACRRRAARSRRTCRPVP